MSTNTLNLLYWMEFLCLSSIPTLSGSSFSYHTSLNYTYPSPGLPLDRVPSTPKKKKPYTPPLLLSIFYKWSTFWSKSPLIILSPSPENCITPPIFLCWRVICSLHKTYLKTFTMCFNQNNFSLSRPVYPFSSTSDHLTLPLLVLIRIFITEFCFFFTR